MRRGQPGSRSGAPRAAFLVLIGCALAVLTALSVLPVCLHSGGTSESGGMAAMTVTDTTPEVPAHLCSDDGPAPAGAQGSGCAVVSGHVPDALQPDPAPQAVPATLPVLPTVAMVADPGCWEAPRYAARDLDLYLLQVQRT